MTLKTMVDQVRVEIGDPSGNAIPWKAIEKWLNDGQSEIARVAKCVTEAVTTNAIDEHHLYPLPDECIELISVAYKDTASDDFRLLVQKDYRYLLQYGLTPGTPVRYAPYRDSIWIQPTPNQDLDDAIKVHYYKNPDTMDSASDVSELPTRFHTCCVHYAVAQAYVLGYVDAPLWRVQAMQQRYERSLAGARADSQSKEADHVRQFGRRGVGYGIWSPYVQIPDNIPEP